MGLFLLDPVLSLWKGGGQFSRLSGQKEEGWSLKMRIAHFPG